MPNSIHYPQTTLEERQQLFDLWAANGDVTAACTQLQLSRATFYYWKDAFATGGYQGLAQDPATPNEQTNVDPIRHPLDEVM